MNYEDSIETIKGIGAKTAALFHKLNVYTVGDLLRYYPRRYDLYEEPVTLAETDETGQSTIGAVLVEPLRLVRAGRMELVTGRLADANGEVLAAKWFHMPYLCSTFRKGMRVVVRGRLGGGVKSRTMEQPELFLEETYRAQMGHMHPIYGLTAGLGNKTIAKAVANVIEEMGTFPETLPAEVTAQYQLEAYDAVIAHIHFPESMEAFVQARSRLVFEEFFTFMLGVRQMKEKISRLKNHFALVEQPRIGQLIQCLPFALTAAQMRAWTQIQQDMTGDGIMNRMVQGDVGSGKTIVAVLAMCLAGLCGYQAVMMAPTAVLARQHYESVTELFAAYDIPLRAVLLTGSLSAKEKREAQRQIAAHEADVIIGTHALIQEKVAYADLALVITDEQHRFGVNQREALSQKGLTPHVLVMSATPIPRSLAIILYGDLDISIIDEKPAKRLPIKNCAVEVSYRPTAYRFIRQQVEEGHQAYVICPMVEESEQMEGENVEAYAEKLRTVFPPSIQVGILHGRMKTAEKEAVMDAFGQGMIHVLVSTTVVEVGIDVPNATVILIEDAQRFGLAQLHQLRGRVGRGKWQSYCILMNTSGSKASKKRLDVLNQSNDGFFIASEDLKLRGPGEFFGVRQSGELEFLLADVYRDADILKQAAEAVTWYLERKSFPE